MSLDWSFQVKVLFRFNKLHQRVIYHSNPSFKYISKGLFSFTWLQRSFSSHGDLKASQQEITRVTLVRSISICTPLEAPHCK